MLTPLEDWCRISRSKRCGENARISQEGCLRHILLRVVLTKQNQPNLKDYSSWLENVATSRGIQAGNSAKGRTDSGYRGDIAQWVPVAMLQPGIDLGNLGQLAICWASSSPNGSRHCPRPLLKPHHL